MLRESRYGVRVVSPRRETPARATRAAVFNRHNPWRGCGGPRQAVLSKIVAHTAEHHSFLETGA